VAERTAAYAALDDGIEGVIFYPFIELYRDSDYEYAPEELGYQSEVDYHGK
jgi:hypothetical protein